MKLAISLNHGELEALQTPVVVEMWDKRKFGRIKRAWLAEFTEAERKAAAKLYPQFYSWYLVKGLPQHKTFMPGTLNLIRRLVDFFGSV